MGFEGVGMGAGLDFLTFFTGGCSSLAADLGLSEPFEAEGVEAEDDFFGSFGT